MKSRMPVWLGVVAVLGLAASVVAVVVVWMLLAAPQQVATAMPSASLAVMSRWLLGAFRFVAAWL